MKAYIHKESLTVGETLDFIKEMNISKDYKILNDFFGPDIITSFKILSDIKIYNTYSNDYKNYKNIIVFTDDSKNKDMDKSLLVSDFLKYANQVDRDAIIIYDDSKNNENSYTSIFYVYREEDTNNLCLGAFEC